MKKYVLSFICCLIFSSELFTSEKLSHLTKPLEIKYTTDKDMDCVYTDVLLPPWAVQKETDICVFYTNFGSEELTRQLIQRDIDAVKAYCESFDRWEPLFELMKAGIAADVSIFNHIKEYPEVDFFEIDIAIRPKFYESLEEMVILLQAYSREFPDKDIEAIKAARDATREAINIFLLYLNRNRDQAALTEELYTNFYQDYFNDEVLRFDLQAFLGSAYEDEVDFNPENRARELIEAHIANIKEYCNSFDKWEGLFDLMKKAVEGDLALFEIVEKNIDVNFFKIDINYRPQFYAMLETNVLLLQEYSRQFPDKDIEVIKQAREAMRDSVNKFLLFFNKNRSVADVAVNLMRKFYQEYFVDDEGLCCC